jgi:hypothetical protein
MGPILSHSRHIAGAGRSRSSRRFVWFRSEQKMAGSQIFNQGPFSDPSEWVHFHLYRRGRSRPFRPRPRCCDRRRLGHPSNSGPRECVFKAGVIWRGVRSAYHSGQGHSLAVQVRAWRFYKKSLCATVRLSSLRAWGHGICACVLKNAVCAECLHAPQNIYHIHYIYIHPVEL